MCYFFKKKKKEGKKEYEKERKKTKIISIHDSLTIFHFFYLLVFIIFVVSGKN